VNDVAFDTETTGLRWDLGDQPFMLQAASAQVPGGAHALTGPAGTPARRRQADRLAAEVLGADRVIAHNLPFDVHMARVDGFDLLGKRLADTDTLARIAAPERHPRLRPKGSKGDDAKWGYRLKHLAETFVDPDARDSEAELERLAELHGFKLKAKPGQRGYMPQAYFELWKREPEAMEFYGREDTRLTLELCHELERRLDEGGWAAWRLEQQVAPILIGAEAKGIAINSSKAATLRAEYVAEAERLRAQLDAELPAGWDDNNESLAEALIGVGVPLTETTESGQIAVNKWALDRQIDNHPILQTLLNFRTAEKFVSTYLDHFIDRDVIHPQFHAIGAWTSRMASSRPNMQNVPVRAGTAVRELFEPRPGHCFVGLDFNQIELRFLGYYMNVPEVTDLIEEGVFFEHMAADAFGGHWQDYRKGTPGEPKRGEAKNGTYAIVYGVGGPKLAKMFGWPFDSVYTKDDWVVKKGHKQPGDPRSLRAEAFIKTVKSSLQGYYYLTRDRIEPQVKATGQVRTFIGRKQWVGYDGAWRALSALVQGSAAEAFKMAMVAATEAVNPLGAYPLLFIHDELIFEAPVEYAEEVLATAKTAMEGCHAMRPKIVAEGHIAYNNWGEAK
jgi:DNA polymerase-1